MSGPEPPGDLLLVEDDEGLSRAWRRAFEAEGWLVRQARDGAEATGLAAGGRWTAAVVDFVLPGAAGLDVVRALRRHHPLVRIVVSTGLQDPALEQLSRAAGADAFLLKPVEVADLLRAVRGGP